jgi:hypothetical protein
VRLLPITARSRIGGYAVGWVPQDGPVGLGLPMAAFTLGAIAAQAMLPRARGR